MNDNDGSHDAATKQACDQNTPLLVKDGPHCSTTPAPYSETHVGENHDHIEVMNSRSQWHEEMWLLMADALPLIGTYLLQYFYSVVTMFVAGHISAESLASASIGLMTMNIIGFAIFEGIATAGDTLCSQAYGSGDLKGVGLHVQRLLILMTLFMIPVTAVWATSPSWLPLFVKQEDLARDAGRFLQISIIGLPGYAYFEALKRFVQARGDFQSSLVVLMFCAPFNVLLNWLLVFHFSLGLPGAALAQALTNALRPAFFTLYVLYTSPNALEESWPSPFVSISKHSRSWLPNFSPQLTSPSLYKPLLDLSVAGFTLNLSEWLAFEILGFSTSFLSASHLAAQTVLTTASILLWHIPFSSSIGLTTRIGQLVGAGAIPQAKHTARISLIFFLFLGATNAAIVGVGHTFIPAFFTRDETVIAIARTAIPVVATFQVFDALICFTSGVLRGLGRQGIAGWAALIVNYLFAVPLALYLEHGPWKWGLLGVWSGLQVGMAVIAAIESWAMGWLKWEDCIVDARAEETRQLLDEDSGEDADDKSVEHQGGVVAVC